MGGTSNAAARFPQVLRAGSRAALGCAVRWQSPGSDVGSAMPRADRAGLPTRRSDWSRHSSKLGRLPLASSNRLGCIDEACSLACSPSTGELRDHVYAPFALTAILREWHEGW